MVIGICDDDKIWYRRAEGLIEQYAEETGQEVALCYFPDTEALLAYEGAPLEVLFMDIELNGENGVKAALQVNAKWAHCQIVFLTNYLNYATDVYEAEHVMFVLKEQFAERLGCVFAKIDMSGSNTENSSALSVLESRRCIWHRTRFTILSGAAERRSLRLCGAAMSCLIKSKTL